MLLLIVFAPTLFTTHLSKLQRSPENPREKKDAEEILCNTNIGVFGFLSASDESRPDNGGASSFYC